LAEPDLTLAVGQGGELQLPGRPGGYEWAVDRLDGADVVAVRSLASAPSGPARPSGGPPPQSYSLPQRFLVEALAPGRAELQMVLRRSWEPHVEPLDRREVVVLVLESSD
jgi:hypothetical protein